MRNRAHIDAGKDRIADGAVLEQLFSRPYGLIEPHVLIDGQRNRGLLAASNGLQRLGVIRSQRLLRQNPFDGFPLARALDHSS